MSRAQFRANSGRPFAEHDGADCEEIVVTGLAGRVQIRKAGANSECWVWLPAGAGATGADGEAGVDRALQHAMLPPGWQQARTCLPHAAGTGICTANGGVAASRRLQMMASTNFMLLNCPARRKTAKHFLAGCRQFLASLALALTSAARMIFMYLSGSFRNFGLHIGQQNFTSWLIPFAASW